MTSAEQEVAARKRAKYLTDLVWHAGAFVVINAFLWMLDLLGPGGVDWAFWVTGGWGFGLAFHALAYFVDGRDLEGRRARQYLEDDRRREVWLH